MNERQTAAVNLVVGLVGALSLLLEPGVEQVLAPLRSSATLLGVGLLGVGVVVAVAQAERRLGLAGVTAVLAVAAVVPVLAAGYAVSGLAGVRATILVGLLALVAVSALRLVQPVVNDSSADAR
jgi:hypothetical protein